MSNDQVPNLDKIVDNSNEETAGLVTMNWLNFFDRMSTGDPGKAWQPSFVGLSASGATSITGKIYKLSRKLAYFVITIVPEVNTSATAGVTYCDNFPLKILGDGANLAVAGGVLAGGGMNIAANNRISVPSWSNVTVPVTIVGIAEVS